MERKKSSKEEKVGSEGLSKKERRALKVQAKQTQNNTELKTIQKNIEPAPVVRVEKNTDGAGEISSKISKDTDNLSDKQKRKLEWEKKQAELGKTIEKKDSTEVLSKAELKAKRREVQEAQRLAKIKAEAEKNKDIKKLKENEKTENKTKNIQSKPKTKSSETQNKNGNNKSTNLFEHLLTSNSFKPIEEVYPAVVPYVHPAFIKFGILYSTGALHGSNEKTVEFLSAIENLVCDLEIPPGEEFSRCLETALDKCVEFLQERKHVTFAMFNALKSFKTNLMQLDKSIPDEEKKQVLIEFIDTFIQDQIVKAGISISYKLQGKLFSNDVILVYGWSHLIFNILVDTYKQHNKNISVIIVDSRPSFGGQEMLKKVAAVGIKHKYVMIHALSHVMPSVTTVLLEADALMTNGYLVSKAGTALIARMAQFCSKPVLVCCETYKFTDKEQTDGMMCNEIGNPDALLENTNQKSPLRKDEKTEGTLFNLLLNLTPSDLVTAVFTELAILPCWSVPAACKAAKLLNMYAIR